jgi:hypothetical protein
VLERGLNAGELRSGERVRGEVGFEIPLGKRGLILLYQPIARLEGQESLRIALGEIF